MIIMDRSAVKNSAENNSIIHSPLLFIYFY
jgi:hypothetical protein